MIYPPGMLKLYSVVMPARNEEQSLPEILCNIYQTFQKAEIPHEIIVIDDNSSDETWSVLQQLKVKNIPILRPFRNEEEHGFGRAITYGLDRMKGDAVVIMMADASDAPSDAVKYWHLLNNEGYECVFGSRFIKGGKVTDYPKIKLLINRLANFFVRILFAIPLNDTTNAFKAYRFSVIKGCRPLISAHFNLSIEIALKAISREYSWTVIPVTWNNRKYGFSKLNVKEMGWHYLFTCLHIWLNNLFKKAC